MHVMGENYFCFKLQATTTRETSHAPLRVSTTRRVGPGSVSIAASQLLSVLLTCSVDVNTCDDKE